MSITLGPYVGGKLRLLDVLLPIMSHIPHSTFCEVFVGMGSVFLNKSSVRNQVINDYDGEVIRLWRCVQRHPAELRRVYDNFLVSREDFEFLREARAIERMTDIERAARIMYLLKCGFGSKLGGETNKPTFAMARGIYNTAVKKNGGFSDIDKVTRRLRSVTIENRDWKDILKWYDAPETLFYLDPPYYKTNDYYQNSFGREQYEIMAKMLRELQGKFVLSLDDCPETREIFAEFDIMEKDFRYALNGKSTKKSGEEKELIISRNSFMEDKLL